MALVSCPECGKQVSSQAASCPHCGIALTQKAALASPAAGSTLEQTLWEATPSLNVLLGETLRVVMVVVLALLAVVLAMPTLRSLLPAQGQRTGAPTVPLVLVVVLALYLAFRGLIIAMRAARLRSTRYRLTNQRLVVERGLLSRTVAEVDLRAVEDIVLRQGPLERLLGIGTVSVVSSDKALPRLLLIGVKDAKATRELIRSQAYAATQRQVFMRST